MVALPEKHKLTLRVVIIIFFLHYEGILSENLVSWVCWPKKAEGVQDIKDYLNCYRHNTSSR